MIKTIDLIIVIPNLIFITYKFTNINKYNNKLLFNFLINTLIILLYLIFKNYYQNNILTSITLTGAIFNMLIYYEEEKSITKYFQLVILTVYILMLLIIF